MELMVLGAEGPFPGADGACSGYLLRAAGRNLLLDMGCGVLPRLMRLMDPARLDAIVISHWHNDHASDLLPLRYYLEQAGKAVPVYAPQEENSLKMACACSVLPQLDLANGFELDGVCLASASVPHPVPAFAVRVEAEGKRFVYTGDLSDASGIVGFCGGTDLLLADGAFLERETGRKRPHLTAKEAAALAAEAKVNRLLITHFSPVKDVLTLEMEAKAVFPNVSAAYGGLRVLV